MFSDGDGGWGLGQTEDGKKKKTGSDCEDGGKTGMDERIKAEAEKKLREQKEALDRQISRGFITREEGCRRLESELYGVLFSGREELTKEEREAWRDSLIEMLGFRKVWYEYFPADLPHPLEAEGMWILKAEGGEKVLDSWEKEGEKILGKSFDLVYVTRLEGNSIRIPARFILEREPVREDQGWTLWGMGHYPGFSGEASLRFDGEMGIAYQKAYRDESDPVWQKKKKTPVRAWQLAGPWE